jgi:hypothetical protein
MTNWRPWAEDEDTTRYQPPSPDSVARRWASTARAAAGDAEKDRRRVVVLTVINILALLVHILWMVAVELLR